MCSKDNFNLNTQPYLGLLDESTPTASQKDIQDVGFFSLIITNFVLLMSYTPHMVYVDRYQQLRKTQKTGLCFMSPMLALNKDGIIYGA